MGQKAAVGPFGRHALGWWRWTEGSLVLLVALAWAQGGLAGTITLQSLGNVKVGDEITASVKVTNKGDEAAYEVKPYFKLGVIEAAGELIEQLEPGQSHRWQVELGKRPLKPGRYPVRLLINYRDANGYQFSALVMLTAVVGEAEPGEVIVSAKPATLSPHGTMKVTVTNRGKEPREVSLVVDTPREIQVEGGQERFLLGAGQERVIEVGLRSVGGLAGSSYAVFARVEYEGADKHFAEFIGTVAKVESSREVPYRRWLLAAALILAAIVLILQIKLRRQAH